MLATTTFVRRGPLLVQSEQMRIGTRALLIIVPVAVLPLVGAGWIGFGVSRRALEERTRAAQIATARFIAERVSVAVRTRGELVLAVEFSLARLAPLVVDSGLGVRGNAAVVDRSGRVVLGSSRQAAASRADSPLVEAALAGRLGALSFTGVDRVERLGASAEVRDLGLVVAIDEPAADALAESRGLARRTAAAVAIALPAGGGA